MSKKLYEESNLQAIANAIREKNNTQNQYTPSQMSNAILQIHGEPNLETLTVTENGNYSPSANKDGFSEVAVNVPNSYTNADEGKVVKNGSLVSQTPRAAGITENGTYDTTENNSVVVNVPSGGGSGDEQTVYWGDEEPLSTLGNDGDVYIRGNIYAFRDSGGKVLRVVNKDYVATSTSQILSTHSAVFQKTVEGPAIAIECQTHSYYGYKGPILISTVEDYVKYTNNQIPWGHIDVDDVTWYIGSFGAYSAAEDSPSIPTYYELTTDLGNIPSAFDLTYAEALVRKFLELAAPSCRSVYVKRNGAWELMAKELNLEILNATNNGIYAPSLGKDGFGKVIVNVSGGEEKPIEATAIVQNDAVVVDGCSIVSQPVIVGGKMSTTSALGLQISPTYLHNVCLEVYYQYMTGPTGVVFSFGGSNNGTGGVLVLTDTLFEFYASGSWIKRTDLNINFGQERHVKFIATTNGELYVVVDDTLVLSASHNYVRNIVSYCATEGTIAVGWNQSSHAEYNDGTFDNVKISFNVDLPNA